jgi:hypothetical protein
MQLNRHRACLLLALLPAMALAADPPELAKAATEDAGTVEAGDWEFAAGAATTWSDRGWDAEGTSADRGGTARGNSVELGLKYGLIDNLDVGVAVGWARESDQAAAEAGDPESGSGLTDIDMGLKWRFLAQDEDRFSMALTAGAAAPMGRGIHENEIAVASEDWSLRGGVVATGWVDRIAYSTALELVRPLGEAADETRYELAWDAAVGIQVLPWLQPEIELHYQTAKAVEGDDTSVWSGTIGLLAPLESCRLAVAWTRGLAGRSADQGDEIAASYTTSF